jgi:DNA processing protein
VLNALGDAPVSIDDLLRATQLPIAIVRTALLELALAGRVAYHRNQPVSLTVEEN